MRRFLGAAALILLATTGAAGKDMSSLYDDATLQFWQSRYQRGVTRNYTEVILPRLTPKERRQLAGVQFAFPLRGTGGDPLAYYATFPPPVVNLPVLSLKFFDDISVALAWLNRGGYSVETPFEYIGMLKYAEPGAFGGRYPPPLKALHIPDDALKSAGVEVLAGKIFDSAIAYVVLHELGHVRFKHPGNGPEVPSDVSRANEEQADRFALEIMRRCESSPTGMAFLFAAFVHGLPNRGDFASEAEYERWLRGATHPLSAERVRSLAATLQASAADFARNERDPAAGQRAQAYIAGQLLRVAQLLADPGAQRLIARIARSTTPEMLAPRHAGEVASATPAHPAAPASGLAFAGNYTGSIGLPDGSVPIKTFLRRSGNRVSGEYYYGAGRGMLGGVVADDTLVFEWREGPERGHGVFRVERDRESFTGSWGFRASQTDGGKWSGRRAGE